MPRVPRTAQPRARRPAPATRRPSLSVHRQAASLRRRSCCRSSARSSRRGSSSRRFADPAGASPGSPRWRTRPSQRDKPRSRPRQFAWRRFYRIERTMDAIIIRDLRVEALIGIHRRERHVQQTLSMDLDIGLPGTQVFESDNVADTIDYEQVALRIKALASAQHYRLVETLADKIVALLISDFGAPWVKVSVAKIGILPNAKFVGVTIERSKL